MSLGSADKSTFRRGQASYKEVSSLGHRYRWYLLHLRIQHQNNDPSSSSFSPRGAIPPSTLVMPLGTNDAEPIGLQSLGWIKQRPPPGGSGRRDLFATHDPKQPLKLAVSLLPSGEDALPGKRGSRFTMLKTRNP